MIKIEDFDFDDILIYKKSYEKILIYELLYKNLIGTKRLRISFDKMDGFMMRVYNGPRYLVLFGHVIIHIKLVINKDHNHYYNNIFLENACF